MRALLRREPLNRKRFLFPVPTPERCRRDKPITVAIACAFQHGVLFCADTKITTGQEKSHESKIVARQWGEEIKNGVTLFTFSGAAQYAAAAIRKCERGIEGLDFRSSSLDEIQDTIENRLVGYYRTHIFPHPDKDRGVNFELLIGLWLDGEMRVLSSEDTALNIVNGYDCVGAGAYLARYWLRQALGPESKYDPTTVTLEEASFIAEYTMNSTVEYDETCDYEKWGEADYVHMMEIGDVGDIREYSHLREFPEALRTQTWTLLRNLVKSKDVSGRKAALDRFVNVVNNQLDTLNRFDDDFRKLGETAYALNLQEKT